MKGIKGIIGLLVILCCVVLMQVNVASATTFTFQPTDTSGNPADMMDLNHKYVYSWLINWNTPSGEEIVSAELKFKKIYDWKYGEYDILSIHLLDDPPALDLISSNADGGLWSKKDSESGGDNWAGQGPLVGTWTDPIGGSSTHAIDLVFTFDAVLLASLNTFVSNDGRFGFGLDPDCHYYNDGITFTVNTTPVPEPATLLLLGLGLVGVRLYGKRKA